MSLNRRKISRRWEDALCWIVCMPCALPRDVLCCLCSILTLGEAPDPDLMICYGEDVWRSSGAIAKTILKNIANHDLEHLNFDSVGYTAKKAKERFNDILDDQYSAEFACYMKLKRCIAAVIDKYEFDLPELSRCAQGCETRRFLYFPKHETQVANILTKEVVEYLGQEKIGYWDWLNKFSCFFTHEKIINAFNQVAKKPLPKGPARQSMDEVELKIQAEPNPNALFSPQGPSLPQNEEILEVQPESIRWWT